MKEKKNTLKKGFTFDKKIFKRSMDTASSDAVANSSLMKRKHMRTPMNYEQGMNYLADFTRRVKSGQWAKDELRGVHLDPNYDPMKNKYQAKSKVAVQIHKLSRKHPILAGILELKLMGFTHLQMALKMKTTVRNVQKIEREGIERIKQNLASEPDTGIVLA